MHDTPFGQEPFEGAAPAHWRQAYFEEGYLRRWTLGPPDDARVQEASDLLAACGLPPSSRVLDLGSGSGRYALALARLGARVVGIDASHALLKRARAHSAKDRRTVHWVRADMRALPLAGGFDLVLVLEAFGYHEEDGDDLRTLRAIRELLGAGGRLLLRNPNGTYIRSELEETIREQRPGRSVTIRSRLVDSGRWLEQDVEIEDAAGLGSFFRRQRIYARRELDDLLGKAGFGRVDHFANHRQDALIESESGRILTIAYL